MKTTGVSGIPKFGLLDFLGHPIVEASTLANIKYGQIFSISLVCANGQNDKEYNFSCVIRISKDWCIRREYFSVLLHGDQEVGPIWWRRLIWSLDSTLPHNILPFSQNPKQCLDKKVGNSPWIQTNWSTDKHPNTQWVGFLVPADFSWRIPR